MRLPDAPTLGQVRRHLAPTALDRRLADADRCAGGHALAGGACAPASSEARRARPAHSLASPGPYAPSSPYSPYSPYSPTYYAPWASPPDLGSAAAWPAAGSPPAPLGNPATTFGSSLDVMFDVIERAAAIVSGGPPLSSGGRQGGHATGDDRAAGHGARAAPAATSYGGAEARTRPSPARRAALERMLATSSRF